METLGDLLPKLNTPVPGERSTFFVEMLAASECPALTQRRARRSERSGAPQDPIVWAQALGSNVVDADGNRYVDLSAGFGAAAVGHAHPRVVRAVQTQAGRLMHALGDLQPSDTKVQLLTRLQHLAPFPDARVMLGLSGADAVEAALKSALLFTKKPGVIAFTGGYHGLSHGPLAMCGYNDAFRAPFAAQLNPHVQFAPYPRDAAQLTAALSAVEQFFADSKVGVGAVLVEPMLGRGGVVIPPASFLRELTQLTHAHGALLILDEIMTGLFRTGPLLASEVAGGRDLSAMADLVCLGKALGGGMPISACLGRSEIMRAWGDPGNEALHTATFYGHPVSAAAALATLEVLHDERLGERAVRVGARLLEQLGALRSKHSCIVEVRGAGLLVGVELRSGALALKVGRKLLERGFITVPAGADASVISLTPPLTITEAQLDAFVDALDACLAELSAISHDLHTRIEAFITASAQGKRDDGKRDELLDELARWQAQHVTSYQKFLASEARRPNGRLPALPTDVFRFTRVAAHDASSDKRVFHTSGTSSGQRGEHAFADLSLYDHAARTAARYALFPDTDGIKLVILAARETETPDSSLSYMLARFGEWFAKGEVTYAFEAGEILVEALSTACKRAEQDGQPVAILGTSFAFVHAEDALGAQRFTLPKGSRIMQTGGFKGRSRSIEPDAMLALLASRYGIDSAWIVQEYGMTELSSQLYETTLREAALELPRTQRRLWIPSWVRAEPIDPDTLDSVASTTEGLLRIDDLANIGSVCAVQTSDLSQRVRDGVVVLGRAPGSLARGCSIALDEWIAATQSEQAPGRP